MGGVRSGQFCLNLAITNGVLCFIHKYNIFYMCTEFVKGIPTFVLMLHVYSCPYCILLIIFIWYACKLLIFLWSLFLIFNFKNDFFSSRAF